MVAAKIDERNNMSGKKDKLPHIVEVGDLVLTVNGIYRWAGSVGAKKGTISVKDDYRFNSVPSVSAFLEEIGPASLSLYLNLADVRISVREDKNPDPYYTAKWIGGIEGEDKWTSRAYTASDALLDAARFIAIRDWHENGCPQVEEPENPSVILKEMTLCSILEDFEYGDKIFHHEKEGDYTLIGTVTSIEDDYFLAQISGSGGNPTEITMTGDSSNPFHLSQWRKLPNEALIKPGDIMSTIFPGYLSVPSGREHFTVTKIEPGKYVCLQSLANEYHSLEFDDDEYGSLDQYLQHWELEG